MVWVLVCEFADVFVLTLFDGLNVINSVVLLSSFEGGGLFVTNALILF